MDQANLQVNGNQVINSTDKTTEIPFSFTVNTNNRTGYTATLSAETENTALTNASSAVGAKIDSISTNLTLNNLPNNTWGYKFGTSTNYAPIPALSTPAQIIQTTGKTNGNESNQLSIGMKLTDNLESGNYQNKLILSFVSNPYQLRAMMTEGVDFNRNLKHLEAPTNKIEHFKKSPVVPVASTNVVNIEDEESDYEIKLWLDSTDKTAYYYAETEKVYLNEDSSSMFYYMLDLTSLNLSNFDTSNVTNMAYMFSNMSSLASLDLSNFDTPKVTDVHNMFSYIPNLTNLDLSRFDTSKVINMSAMFSNMLELTNLNLSNLNTSQVTNMSNMFSYMPNLINLDLSSFDTSKVTDMSFMFCSTSKLTSLDLSGFNTSKVTTMRGMFSEMVSLTSLNLSSFNTSNVTNMGAMFSNMSNLKNLNIQSFNTENVKDMNSMFAFTLRIPTLNLSHFDTRNVTNMSDMFYGCGSTSIDVSNFNTQNVETMAGMFGSVSNVQILDLSSFTTPKVKDFSRMFLCDNGQVCELQKIFASNDFDVSAAKQYSQSHLTANYEIFHRRFSLRGGEGTYWGNPDLVNLDGLRIDDPANGRPGYFTRKP